MAFEYPTGHVLSPGGYRPPSERPARTTTRAVTTGAEPPQYMVTDRPLALGTGVGAGAGFVGFGGPAPPPQPPGFPPILPVVAGAVAVGGLITDILMPDVGLIQRNGPTPGEPYGVPFGGPGLKEPGGKYLLKEWHIRMDSKEGDFDLQFYLTINDRGTKRVFMYNQRTKGWKTWPMPRLAVIGKNMPSHQMITRLRRNLKRHTDDAVTILKLTSPGKLESTHKRGGRYVPGRKRWID